MVFGDPDRDGHFETERPGHVDRSDERHVDKPRDGAFDVAIEGPADGSPSRQVMNFDGSMALPLALKADGSRRIRIDRDGDGTFEGTRVPGSPGAEGHGAIEKRTSR